jgi:diguanylate cyclase (GGDEF)-like protein
VADINWSSISGDLRVTISAGVADIRAHEAPENILTRADLALYRAKDAGRNRVMAA